MRPLIDLTGRQFGRLTVIARAPIDTLRPSWTCQCECGKHATVAGSQLRSGRTNSCGCLRIDMMVSRSRRHGHAPRGKLSGEYRAWAQMRQHCYNPNNPDFHYYGGRGIAMCDEWRDDFPVFLRDMGPRPYRAATLDRIDVNGDYRPSNCRWASRRTQSNNRRMNIRIVYGGASMTVAELATLTGLDYAALLRRTTKEGQTADQAVMALRNGRKRRPKRA